MTGSEADQWHQLRDVVGSVLLRVSVSKAAVAGSAEAKAGAPRQG
jgi:hypothetical protein